MAGIASDYSQWLRIPTFGINPVLSDTYAHPQNSEAVFPAGQYLQSVNEDRLNQEPINMAAYALQEIKKLRADHPDMFKSIPAYEDMNLAKQVLNSLNQHLDSQDAANAKYWQNLKVQY